MKNVNRFFLKPSTIALLSVLLFAAGIWMRGQTVQAQSAPQVIDVGGVEITGVPNDWTHHHLVFSNPGTEEEATQNGRHEKWSKTVNDPRYVIQQLQRHAPAQGPAATAVAQLERLRTLGTPGSMDAKDAGITAGPLLWQALRRPWRSLDRENPRALAIAGLQLAILVLGLAFATASLRRRQWAPTLLLMLSTAVFVSLTSCGGLGTPNSGVTTNSGDAASGLSQDWNTSVGTATAPTPLAYPAKWSFSTSTASCANDFVIYPTGQAGSGTHASIIAYYNLYTSGCSGTVPLTDWAYNTGGTVSLAPVFSAGGNQIAFIQTSSSVASLVLLTYPLTPPGTGTLGVPIAPTTASSASNFYTGTSCPTPCMYKIALSGNPGDTWSSPYYDYGTDSLYVGDSLGELHKFTPVFKGAPAEVVTSGVWPAQLKNKGAAGNNGSFTNDTNQVSTPVYDGVSGDAYVGTENAGGTGGYLYAVTSAGTLQGFSHQLDKGFGIQDAPLLDQVAGELYVFVGQDEAGSDAGVFQFATSFTSGVGTEQALSNGNGNAGGTFQLAGTFDNVYYSSGSSSPTGSIYMSSETMPGTLVRIPISSNTMGTPVVGPSLVTATHNRSSPVTEFCNNGSSSCAVQTATGCTFTTGTETIACSGGGFSSADVGAAVVGTGIQSGATITSVTNPTTVIISAVPSANESSPGVTLTIGVTNSGTDYVFLSVYDSAISGGSCSGESCVMSYNVSNPATFSSSLTPVGEQNIATSTTGVAPTGGIIIDNSSTSTGASQVYFLTQDPGAAHCVGPTNGTAAAGICAIQGSQSAP